MTESQFTTELSTGEEIPVRRVGSIFIVGFDHIPVDEFINYVDLLLADEGVSNDYDTEDVTWLSGVVVDFGDEDDVPRLKVNDALNPSAIDATVLECW